MLQKPLSVEEIKKLRKPIRNVNSIHREKLSSLDMCAVWVTEHVGTMGFFLIVFFWTITWLGVNTLLPEEFHFDPFPAFVLWLFISNLIQIFLMPLIMIGQNLQGKHAEARAEDDFDVNTKAEREIETILLHLENQNEMMSEILNKLESK